MKMRNVWMFLAVLMGALTWTSCSEEDPAPVVGITAISVTPEGSSVSYNATITGTTAVVEVDGETTDEALANATVSAVATLGSAVYFNDEPVGAGVTADFTAPVTLVAKGADGKSVAYTVTVERVFGNVGMTIKSSRFNGFPANLVDYDVTYFKGKFYAITASTTTEGEVVTEHYDLFSSVDGVNWVKVDYNTITEGVDLPNKVSAEGEVLEEKQEGYVVGGEGARLLVHNDRMYVLGGARLKGQDIYGNAPEVMDWGWGPLVSIDNWRSFSTADGETFKCDTVGMSVTRAGEPWYSSSLIGACLNVASFKGKMYIQGGYNATFGMWQMGRRYATTENGTAWEVLTTVGVEEGVQPKVEMRAGNAFFEFNGKLWCLGGYENFLDATMMRNTIWSSEDGIAWKQEAEFPVDAEGNQVEGLDGIYDMTVVPADGVVYLFGGATLNANGGNVSNKIFKSTDCLVWEEVADVPAAFSARRHTVGVAQGNEAWLFGGISDVTNDTYGYPLAEPFTPVTETWVKTLD
jgi:hypothetical protein